MRIKEMIEDFLDSTTWAFWKGVILILICAHVFGSYGEDVCKETLKVEACHLEWTPGAEEE